MATINVRDQEYELAENEYALLNSIILFLILLDPRGSERFVRMDASLEDLRRTISEKYNEASASGQDAIKEMGNRVMFALNIDHRLFPDAVNYRKLAYEYIKLIVPAAPILDPELAGSVISVFLLAISIPESLRTNSPEIPPSAPKASKAVKGKKKGFNSPLEVEADLDTSSKDEVAGALIDQLEAIKHDGVEDKVVSINAIAAIAPEIMDVTDAHYASLLAEQRANTVTILKKAEIAPLSEEEELGG